MTLPLASARHLLKSARLALNAALYRLLCSPVFRVAAPLLMLALIVLPLAALAAEAVPTPVNPDLTDPGMVAKLVMNAIAGKQWGIVICGAVLTLITTAKKFIPETTKAGAWLHSKPGGWLTNFGTTMALSLLTAFLAGQHVSTQLVVGSLFASLSGAGLLELIRDIFKKDDPAAAQLAGIVAQANPKNTLNG